MTIVLAAYLALAPIHKPKQPQNCLNEGKAYSNQSLADDPKCKTGLRWVNPPKRME